MQTSTCHEIRAGALGFLLMLGAGSPGLAFSSGTFQIIGKMTGPSLNVPLENATLLSDGTVLLTGGGEPRGQEFVAFADAGRYDPATNSFTPVQPMTTPRQSHASVRLQDGRVLIVGGWNGKHSLHSAELFDPTTGRFTPTAGLMIQARSGPSATLLQDGRVLIIGGWNDDTGEAYRTAELFDPVTGQFQKTGSMPAVGGAALALPDGRVITFIADRSVQIYDPATGAFSRLGQRASSRANFSASLLPTGKILLAGGGYIKGGKGVGTDELEIFDPTTGQSNRTGSLLQARYGHFAVTLADGRVLVAGGVPDRDGAPLRSAELVDPVTGQASPTGELAADGGIPILLPDGRVLIVGSRASNGELVVQSYTP